MKGKKGRATVAQSGLQKMHSPRGGVAQRQRSARSKNLTGRSDELVLLINVVDPLICCHGGIENKYMNLQQWKAIPWQPTDTPETTTEIRQRERASEGRKERLLRGERLNT